MDDIFDFERNEFIGPKDKIQEIYRILGEGGQLGIRTWLSIEDTEWMGQSVYTSHIGPDREGKRKEVPILYSKENERGMRILLSSIGFTDVACMTEHYSIRFFNGEEYWEKMLAKGWCTHLTAMKLKSEELEKLKIDVMQRLENRRHTDGFYFSTSVIYAFGTK